MAQTRPAPPASDPDESWPVSGPRDGREDAVRAPHPAPADAPQGSADAVRSGETPDARAASPQQNTPGPDGADDGVAVPAPEAATATPPPPRFAPPGLPPTPPQPGQYAAPSSSPQRYQQQYQQPVPDYGRAIYPATAGAGYRPAQPSPQLYLPRNTRKASPARVGRRLLRRTVMGVSAAFQAIFGVRPLLVVAFLALLGFTGWLAFDKWLAPVAPSLTPNAPNNSPTIVLPPEAPTVLTYLQATKKGDANAVWDTFGAEEKARRLERGDDKSVLAGVLEYQQRNNVYYSTYHFIGARGMDGTDDVSRGGMYFYVADVKFNGETRSLPLLFMVDAKGQITQVNDTLYSIMLQQLAGGGGTP